MIRLEKSLFAFIEQSQLLYLFRLTLLHVQLSWHDYIAPRVLRSGSHTLFKNEWS
jgi:hypothetical protein